MNDTERNMLFLLKELKENYHACCIKIEFGEEGTLPVDAAKLKRYSDLCGLNFTVKIGGCEAVRDLYDVRNLKAESIVAPMIESTYAAKKFIECTKNVFLDDELDNKKLYINIETISGYKCLKDIMEEDFASNISGIVFGRTDFVKSLGMEIKNINSEIIFDYANEISTLVQTYNKEFVIGGNITPNSIPFLKKVKNIDKIETRNIIFDSKILNHNDSQKGIIKALEFEIHNLKTKSFLLNKDKNRIKILEERCRESKILI